jgi:hypothetical protein
VDLPTVDPTSEGWPFKPFANERKVLVSFRIPVLPKEKDKEIRNAMAAALRDLPVPAYLKCHDGKKLFAAVTPLTSDPHEDKYKYIDKNYVDATKGGAVVERRDDRSFKSTLFKYECVVTGAKVEQ